MIDRLVANGWVERRAQPGDRRVKRVYLTPEAERVHKRIWRVAEDTVEDRARRSVRRGRASSCSHCCSASRRRWFPAPTVRRKVRRSSPGEVGVARRCAGSTAGSRRDAAAAKTGADRRARARHRRRAGLLAAGRPPRHDRERLRQGRHHPDRQRSSRPYHRGADQGPFDRHGGRRAGAARSRALSARAGQGRGRDRFRARRRRTAQGEPARDHGPKPRRPRTS